MPPASRLASLGVHLGAGRTEPTATSSAIPDGIVRWGIMGTCVAQQVAKTIQGSCRAPRLHARPFV